MIKKFFSRLFNRRVERFKKGAVNSPSRDVGETLLESVGERIFQHKRVRDRSYDALDIEGKKWEYKSGRVVFKDKEYENLYDKYMNFTDLYSRLAKISDIRNGDVDVNIQNLKPHKFDWLMYVLISDDGFDWYRMSTKELVEKVDVGEFPNWSGKHGGEEEAGKNCQFIINSSNLEWHEQYKFKHISWEEMIEITKGIKTKRGK